MKINFLTLGISDKSGGAIYDKNFYEIMMSVYSDVTVYDDEYFKKMYKKDSLSLVEFNKIYRENIEMLFDCDYLLMNSRIYTRFVLVNIQKVASKHQGVKIMVIHHHNNYMNNKGFRKLIHKHFELLQLRAATELIIPNQYVIDILSKERGMPPIKCLPSSFEKKEFPVSSLNNKKILFVGTVEPRKGIDYGLKAFNEFHKVYSEYTFLIAGRTDAEPKYFEILEKYVEENNLEEAVFFEGRVSDERLKDLYESADIFLFPSLLEGYGWVMIEAMGRGIPVVAFDNSAMPYTVKDGYNGRLIPNKNWKMMGRKLIEMVERNDVKKMQKGALETFWSVPSKDELNKMTLDYIRSWK